MSGILKIKRVYEAESSEDGKRILADRLWPRGISKARADIFEWPKQAAPETAERKAFHEGKETFDQFEQHYLQFLNDSQEAARLKEEVLALLKEGNVTLVYGSKNPDENNAIVLKRWIESDHQKAE